MSAQITTVNIVKTEKWIFFVINSFEMTVKLLQIAQITTAKDKIELLQNYIKDSGISTY